MKSTRTNRGTTLIELIMTIVVLAIVSVPLSLSLVEQVQDAARSQEFRIALNLARNEMENVNNLAYTSIVTATTTNSGYTITRTVSMVYGTMTGTRSLKKIIVTARKTGGAQDLVNLVTYIARNVTYGL